MILVLVGVAAFAAGFVNALAGGGSFLTFPALMAAGLSPIAANASSAVALYPGQIATAFLARDGLVAASRDERIDVPLLSLVSLVGGLVGGLLLLVTPDAIFRRIVPWLILFATLVFATGNVTRASARKSHLGRRGIALAQGLVSIYGGYFGGGIGILMLAVLTLFGLRDLWLMNSLKILLAVLMNTAAVVAFVVAGLVDWPSTTIGAIGALAGGFAGIHAARRTPTWILKGFVVLIGVALTTYFFIETA
jgi:uncharacterized membrane protein YfcA